MVAMVQMSIKRIFTDGYGMSICRISRRNVTDIHFGPLRYCGRHIEARNADKTMNEKKCLPVRHHLFLFMT